MSAGNGEPRRWPTSPDLAEIMAAALFGITTLVGPSEDEEKPDMAGTFSTSADGILTAEIILPDDRRIEMKLRQLEGS